jgi:hypothetical protein
VDTGVGPVSGSASAVHAYLDAHPEVAMSRTEELNFFNGPEVAPDDDAESWWRTGQWHRHHRHDGTERRPEVPARLREAFDERVRDDVDRLRSLVDDELEEFSR